MNEIRPVWTVDDDLETAREILGRHRLPDLVVGYDLELGEVHDEPALWIVFHLNRTLAHQPDPNRARPGMLRHMIQSVHEDLQPALHVHYPYYRFDEVEGYQPAS